MYKNNTSVTRQMENISSRCLLHRFAKRVDFKNWISVCVWIQWIECVYVCTNVYTCVCTCKVCVYTCVTVCVYVYVCVDVYVYMYIRVFLFKFSNENLNLVEHW